MEAYSAGLMSQSFWFIEFKKVVKLVSDGKSQNDIKAACVEENLLGAVNPYRAKRVAGYLTNRVSTLDAREIQMFIESDLATQKLLNLIAVLRTDRLFFEFYLKCIVKKSFSESRLSKTVTQTSSLRTKARRATVSRAGKNRQSPTCASAISIIWPMPICLCRTEKRAESRRLFWI